MICPWRRVEPIPRCALPWRAQPVRGGKSKIFDDSSHAIEFGARRNGISSLEIGRRTKNLPIDDRKDHEEILLYLREFFFFFFFFFILKRDSSIIGTNAKQSDRSVSGQKRVSHS